MRFFTLNLTAWYLLVATNLLFIAADWIAPQTKTVVKADFACALHDCACKTAKQCNTHCCCAKTARAPHAESHDGPVTVKVSSLSAAKCGGHHSTDTEASAPQLDLHVLNGGGFVPRPASVSSQWIPRASHLLTRAVEPPDHVPILFS